MPAAVPSGAAVVGHVDNPAREEVALHNTATGGAAAEARPPQTITVAAGESIQSAVDRARPGDTVEIPYGIYHERVVIDLSDLTLHGVPNEAGEFPILDGENRCRRVSSPAQQLHRRLPAHAQSPPTTVLVEGDGRPFPHSAENVGTYGIYPVRSTDVLIERVISAASTPASMPGRARTSRARLNRLRQRHRHRTGEHAGRRVWQSSRDNSNGI
jgi:hypothetical protein